MLALETVAAVRMAKSPSCSRTKTMWIRKLTEGVLRITTPLGPRYLRPSWAQRIYLLWVFRHFQILPLQVLNRKQQKLVETLCARQRFVSMPPVVTLEDAPILGTVERRPPVEIESLPPRRPASGVSEAAARAAGGLQQRS
jgi:hypothetical protein